MYEIVVEQHFEAAHALRGYKGKCENTHGHRYGVVVRLKTSRLNDIGMAYDFGDIKHQLREIINKYDHAFLNDIPPFDLLNPSAEYIAATIHNQLMDMITGQPVVISAVEVWENPHQGVIYTPALSSDS